MSSTASRVRALAVVATITISPFSATWPQTGAAAVPGQSKPTSQPSENPAAIFQRGQDALRAGRLDAAEQAFRHVLAIDPRSGAAYANLGVVYMRRKQWNHALKMFGEAQKRMPGTAGIQLNIGLVYYHQHEFLKAIPHFEVAMKEQPDAVQPRYLLGLCYFFARRWEDAATTLQPLWEQESGNINYLYVLMIAADRAGQKELDDRAYEQLLNVGGNSPNSISSWAKRISIVTSTTRRWQSSRPPKKRIRS